MHAKSTLVASSCLVSCQKLDTALAEGLYRSLTTGVHAGVNVCNSMEKNIDCVATWIRLGARDAFNANPHPCSIGPSLGRVKMWGLEQGFGVKLSRYGCQDCFSDNCDAAANENTFSSYNDSGRYTPLNRGMVDYGW